MSHVLSITFEAHDDTEAVEAAQKMLAAATEAAKDEACPTDGVKAAVLDGAPLA